MNVCIYMNVFLLQVGSHKTYIKIFILFYFILYTVITYSLGKKVCALFTLIVALLWVVSNFCSVIYSIHITSLIISPQLTPRNGTNKSESMCILRCHIYERTLTAAPQSKLRKFSQNSSILVEPGKSGGAHCRRLAIAAFEECNTDGKLNFHATYSFSLVFHNLKMCYSF